jgi:hypothetical protein
VKLKLIYGELYIMVENNLHSTSLQRFARMALL